MRKLLISLSDSQFAYLFDIKKRHKISMGSQLRGLVKDRMEGRTLTIETRSRSRPIYSKRGDSKYLPSLNKEFKELLEHRRRSKT